MRPSGSESTWRTLAAAVMRAARRSTLGSATAVGDEVQSDGRVAYGPGAEHQVRSGEQVEQAVDAAHRPLPRLVADTADREAVAAEFRGGPGRDVVLVLVVAGQSRQAGPEVLPVGRRDDRDARGHPDELVQQPVPFILR